MKVGVSGVPLQWPAVTKESSHGIAVGTSSAVLYAVTNYCRCKKPSLDLTICCVHIILVLRSTSIFFFLLCVIKKAGWRPDNKTDVHNVKHSLGLNFSVIHFPHEHDKVGETYE